MEASEIRKFTLNLSNYYLFSEIICIGETQVDDMGYHDLARGISCMSKLEDVKVNFAHTKRLRLKDQLKI